MIWLRSLSHLHKPLIPQWQFYKAPSCIETGNTGKELERKEMTFRIPFWPEHLSMLKCQVSIQLGWKSFWKRWFKRQREHIHISICRSDLIPITSHWPITFPRYNWELPVYDWKALNFYSDSASSWRVNNEDSNENLEELSEEWAHLLEDELTNLKKRASIKPHEKVTNWQWVSWT